jgi:hypothetical protein
LTVLEIAINIQHLFLRVLCDTVRCYPLETRQTTVQPQQNHESWKPPRRKRLFWQRSKRGQPSATKRQTLRQRSFWWQRALAKASIARSIITGAIFSSIAMGVSFAMGSQMRASVDYVPRQTNLFKAAPINVFHLPPVETFWLSPEELQRRAARLFATPDSIGTIALGAAEGTRTKEGHKTEEWSQHIDPGNGAVNKGTFSWQLGAKSAEEADRKGLARIQSEAVPQLIQAAVQEKVGFDMETLIQGADLWNQSPDAGASFVQSLKRCLQQEYPSTSALLLCARSQSFYDPTTGELEASGFAGDSTWLEDDQSRRIEAIQHVLAANQERLLAEFSHAN